MMFPSESLGFPDDDDDDDDDIDDVMIQTYQYLVLE